MAVDYKKLYFRLAGKVSNMIELSDLIDGSPDKVLKQVREGLIRAMQEAEEEYLEQGD